MKSKLNYEYDCEHDLADITIDESFGYGKSIDVANGIVLDLDENAFPAALEIISASKVLGIDKKHLISPNIDIAIKISADLICIELKFAYLVSKCKQASCFKQNIANDYGIPEMGAVYANYSEIVADVNN